MKTTPHIFIPMNPSGGTRRSTIMALVALTLQKSGNRPILIDFGSNLTFTNTLKAGLANSKIYQMDPKNLDEDRIRELLALARVTGESIVADLEANAGMDVFGAIQRAFARGGKFIGLVPTIAHWSTSGIIEVCSVFQPAALIKVGFGRAPKSAEEQAHEAEIDKLSPAISIVLEELPDETAHDLIQIPPAPYWNLEAYADSSDISAVRWSVLADFWNDSYLKIQAALLTAAPLCLKYKSVPDYAIPDPQEIAAFGSAWIGSDRYERHVKSLIARYESSAEGDGFDVEIYCTAAPASFYTIHVLKCTDGVGDPQTAFELETGASMDTARLSADIGRAISEGMLALNNLNETTTSSANLP